MKPRRDIEEYIRIPIYRGDLHLIFSSDIHKARAAKSNLFGESKVSEGGSALCSYNQSVNALFFGFDVRHGEIAHECFHLTHRILEWADDEFSPRHHEPYAYLNGWLTGFVYHVIALHKIKVRDVWP